MRNWFKRSIVTLAIAAMAMVGFPAVAGAAPADGRCVATGAGATFDGQTKASVARGGLMSFVILDHAFNGADATEALLGLSICD